jgi:hypothetical protein
MTEIDWSKAPEGATHYYAGLDSCICRHWIKSACNERHWMDTGGEMSQWRRDPAPVDLSLTVCRPSPIWSGTGLPPVGMILQVAPRFKQELGTVKVVGFNGRSIVCVRTDGDDIGSYRGFLPDELIAIRTPEQIAADEREAAITEFCELIGRNGTDFVRATLARIYDAGYRRKP